jgi:hypothetical protein
LRARASFRDAQYATALQDVLNRKLVAVTSLLSAVEYYQATHGREVGLHLLGATDDVAGVHDVEDGDGSEGFGLAGAPL